MNIEIKSSGGFTAMPLDARQLSHRRVYVEGEINRDSATEFMKKIIHLNDEDTKKKIMVFVNSAGGEIRSGMLMYDVIQGSVAPIVMCCTGIAYSMAAVLLACGNHGRYMLPHSKAMIHEPLTAMPFGGSASSVRSVADSMLDERNRMNEILARHTGKTEKEICKAASYDHYFTSEEAVKFGLCDRVVDFSEMIRFKI